MIIPTKEMGYKIGNIAPNMIVKKIKKFVLANFQEKS